MTADEPEVLILYADSDESWRELLRVQLSVFERQALLRVWDRREIFPGMISADESAAALERADIVLVLLSPDFLMSEMFRREWPRVLQLQQEERTLVFPVVVRETNWADLEGIASLRIWPKGGIALAARPRETIDGVVAALADEVARIAGELVEGRSAEDDGDVEASSPSSMLLRPNVFISHSKADRDFAELLKSRLEKAGFRPWFDSQRLKAGADWRSEIDQALRGAQAVIVVMSSDAQGSDYVTYEWAFACGVGIPVIPLLVRPATFHPRLATLQHLDFRRVRRWSTLVARLHQVMVPK